MQGNALHGRLIMNACILDEHAELRYWAVAYIRYIPRCADLYSREWCNGIYEFLVSNLGSVVVIL